MSTVTPVNDPLVGHVFGDRYRLVEKLARGGMATVYRAVDTRLDRTVAVKVMHEGLGDDMDFARKFDREARAAARLSHPNIVAVFDQGEDRGRPYIVMEYVEGRTLRQVIATQAPLSPEKALSYIEPVVKALAAAHEVGLVHCDVKPENVIISDRGVVKVADFGTSRLLEKSHATTVIGSPPYMAPEHFQGRAVLPSDIYSVGVILYQMLTGTLPYASPNPAQIERMVAQGRCTPAKLRNSQVPKEISDIIVKAMASDLSVRYQRASEVLEDLATATDIDHKETQLDDIRKRLKAREVPKRGFCWHCRKPLHARATSCPFCGEAQ